MPITGHTIDIFGLKSFRTDLWYVWILFVQLNAERTSASWLNPDFAKSQEMLYRNFKFQQKIVGGLKTVLLLMIKTYYFI